MNAQLPFKKPRSAAVPTPSTAPARVLPLANLSNEILILIFDYLADQDLVSISRTCHRFHALLPVVLLSNIRYLEDPTPIRGPGQPKTKISDLEHWEAAQAALLHAFRVRLVAAQYPKTGLGRIMLYRVSDKGRLTGTEKKRFTVPGPFWTVEKTAAWILGGIFSNTPFVLVTPPNVQTSFVEGDKRRRSTQAAPAIYAREILQILSSGYTIDRATPEERPRNVPHDVLVLRPPRGSERTGRTRLSAALWNRDEHEPTALLIKVYDQFVSASQLAEYFQQEIEKIRQTIANALEELDEPLGNAGSFFGKPPPGPGTGGAGLGGVRPLIK